MLKALDQRGDHVTIEVIEEIDERENGEATPAEPIHAFCVFIRQSAMDLPCVLHLNNAGATVNMSSDAKHSAESSLSSAKPSKSSPKSRRDADRARSSMTARDVIDGALMLSAARSIARLLRLHERMLRLADVSPTAPAAHLRGTNEIRRALSRARFERLSRDATLARVSRITSQIFTQPRSHAVE